MHAIMIPICRLDVSTSFKRLQAEKTAADAILQELTPLESVRESDAIRDYLSNISLKAEASQRFLVIFATSEFVSQLTQEEIKRLNTKLQSEGKFVLLLSTDS